MDIVIKFLKEYFNMNVVVLFFISSLFLIYFDSKEFKKKNMKREYRFSLYIGIGYIVVSVGIYVFTKFI